MSFKKRLTISLISVAIVPVLIVSLVLSERSVKTTRAQYEHTMERILDSNATNMDRALKNTYEALIQLVSTPDLISMLNSMAQGETDLNLETRVDKPLRQSVPCRTWKRISLSRSGFIPAAPKAL